MPKYGFEIFWSDEDEGYIATCPDFPGLSAFGETQEEAAREANVALGLFIQSYEEDGESLPCPTKIPEYSGQIRLRMPKDLHGRVAKAASKEGVSLNTYLVALISEQNTQQTIVSEIKGLVAEVSMKAAKREVIHHHIHHGNVVSTGKVVTEYSSSYPIGEKYGKVTYSN
jgi:predicted RNase H-like HicB family nuclease